MKNKIIIYLITSLMLFSSCESELDYSEVVSYDKSQVFSSFTRIGEFVTNIYGRTEIDLWTYSGAMLASATDEAEYALPYSAVRDFYNGSWSGTNTLSTSWQNSYQVIRAVNFYLESSEGQTFEGNMYDKDYNEQMKRFKRYEYEVRFLRAMAYFNLIRQHGGVPLTTSTLKVEESITLERSSAEEIFKFIVDECDAIADELPNDYNKLQNDAASAETGRATRLTVLALKGRTLMYRASPLFNTSGDKQLWNEAAKANKKVIDACLENGVSLGSYTNLWGTDSFKASEMIFVRRMGDSNALEAYNFPVGVEGGNSGNCPTQTLVDAYEMKATGKLWNEAGSGFNADKPYEGRDPRFGMTIAKNGDEKWPAYNEKPLETFEGGANGLPKSGATPTGYYLKKYLDNTVDLRPSTYNYKRHGYILFRLGEFYLNYAESVFNTLESADATSGDFPMSAREAVNVIRSRTGVDMPLLEAGLSKDVFERKYMNERMVELAFEGHRFWDVRRWKKGELFKSITCMKITRSANGELTYTRFQKTRLWEDKMYLFPIWDAELRRNKALTQTPGW